MTNNNLPEIWKTQKSLTEWLQDINHADTALLRQEDNEKRERLKVLHNVIDLPFDEPTQFEASDITNKTPAFEAYLQEHGKELCALRLIPKQKDLPKLRMRGKSIQDATAWFFEQDIDASAYRADFIPHPPDEAWATIFVVNQHGIQGEIIYGGHHQLTQGLHEAEPPHVFWYDFSEWHIEPANDAAIEHLKTLAGALQVTDPTKQQQLTRELGATFSHDYIEGYFETTNSSLGTWFIDYSPALGKLYADLQLQPQAAESSALVHGQTGSKGTATGTVHIVDPEHIDITFPEGGILVCKVTTPLYVPLMQKAAAIVTDQGGILSHAAIVARELKKPCIVATSNATQVLKEGQAVTVDADSGQVYSVK